MAVRRSLTLSILAALSLACADAADFAGTPKHDSSSSTTKMSSGDQGASTGYTSSEPDSSGDTGDCVPEPLTDPPEHDAWSGPAVDSDAVWLVAFDNVTDTTVVHPRLVLPWPKDGQSMLPGDVDADGQLDLIVRGNTTGYIGRSLGDDSAQFVELTDLAPHSVAHRDDFRVADMNADGYDDIVYTDDDRGTIRWLRSQGDGSFSPGVIGSFLNGDLAAYNWINLVIGDLNGDEAPDLVVDMEPARVGGKMINLVLVLSNGDGHWEHAPYSPLVPSELDGLRYASANWAISDADRDGQSDLLTVSWEIEPSGEAGSLYFIASHRGLGDGQLAPMEVFELPPSVLNPPTSSLFADLNHDDRLDAIIVGDKNFVCLAQPHGGFEPCTQPQNWTNVRVQANGRRDSVVAADFTGNGQTDLAWLVDAWGEADAGTMGVVAGRGCGYFSPGFHVGVVWSLGGDWMFIDEAVTDIDGDGQLELLGAGRMSTG